MRRKEQISKEMFVRAYDELSDALFRHAFFRVSDREVALDIVQNAFMKTWQHIIKGEEVRSLKPFLYRVVGNLVIDYYRKSKSESLDSLLEDGFDPTTSQGGSEEMAMSAEVSLALKSLESLPEQDRSIITLRFVDGLSIEDISKFLNKSENAVSVSLHRAVEKAKKNFNS